MTDPVAEQIAKNVADDPAYAPYCLGCSSMDRMTRREPYLWRCGRCGATCDLREYVAASRTSATLVSRDGAGDPCEGTCGSRTK